MKKLLILVLFFLIQIVTLFSAKDILKDISWALGQIKTKNAVKILIRYLKETEDNKTRYYITFALSEIKLNDAIEPLIELIKGSNDVSLLLYASWLLGHLSHLCLEIKSEEIINLLVKISHDKKDLRTDLYETIKTIRYKSRRRFLNELKEFYD